MKLKAIIFDLDGTIADTLPLCIAAFKKSIEPLLGKTLSDDEIIATFGPSEEGTIRALVPDQEAQGVQDYLRYYEEMHSTCPAVFPGITGLLAMLDAKGVQLAIVTGKGIHSTRLSLKQFGIEKYFDVLETGSPEGPNKVNGIRNVLERLNIEAADALYVGDAPSDIKYCKQVSLPIASVAWAGTTNADELIPLQPEHLFYTVEEFREWLETAI
ncbi:HAD family hydrolase [Mucilaginibacter myungsuensis]|uniref:phosphoglycolate phosphatase n=1 Tax=Mucilaginibacter myungsuensis TaxID=649104 RepID=A0A929KYE2_9SPHI|nr:HAD family hydrolase [Mucilaginibacter myungsuensis]MBE9662815.1 HAD family hydrolase [Mucilaginibacter myungsuensis]MDN3598235.1 HAD family hydrolase [Mucilaginibacter myungsuensis]